MISSTSFRCRVGTKWQGGQEAEINVAEDHPLLLAAAALLKGGDDRMANVAHSVGRSPDRVVLREGGRRAQEEGR